MKFYDGCGRISFRILHIDKVLEVASGKRSEGQMPGTEEWLDMPMEHIPVAVQRIMAQLAGHHVQPLLHEVGHQHILWQRRCTGCCTLCTLSEIYIQASIPFGISRLRHITSHLSHCEYDAIFSIQQVIHRFNRDCGRNKCPERLQVS